MPPGSTKPAGEAASGTGDATCEAVAEEKLSGAGTNCWTVSAVADGRSADADVDSATFDFGSAVAEIVFSTFFLAGMAAHAKAGECKTKPSPD